MSNILKGDSNTKITKFGIVFKLGKNKLVIRLIFA